MEREAKEKLLLVRMDRIGDLVLTLPVDQCLSKEAPQAQWWLTKGLDWVAGRTIPLRSFSVWGKDFSWKKLGHAVKMIRRDNIRAAVVFHAPWWVGFALFLARVPLRVGRYSQWHSFLFFNRGLRQKRSRGEKHELDYNLELLDQLPREWVRHPLKIHPLKLRPNSSSVGDHPHGEVDNDSASKSVGSENKTKDRFVVVHPGMGGSALNWPSLCYLQLIQRLPKESNVSVKITGTAQDESFLKPLRQELSSAECVEFLDGKLSGEELIDLLGQAAAVVAPSTGVAHLAAAVGTPTLGLYSPIQAEHPRRWAPLAAQGGTVKVFTGNQQTDPDQPMESISVDEVMQQLREWLA